MKSVEKKFSRAAVPPKRYTDREVKKHHDQLSLDGERYLPGDCALCFAYYKRFGKGIKR